MCSTHNAAVILYLSLLVIASPAFAQDPALMENGNHPEETYDGIRENVNLATGNVNLSLTLLKLPGRNGLDYVLPMNYNSQVWYLPNSNPSGWAIPSRGIRRSLPTQR